MPQKEYIKYLCEKEELSIKKISDRVGINWRTASKYAKKEDWNTVSTNFPFYTSSAFCLNLSEFPTGCFFAQFSFLKKKLLLFKDEMTTRLQYYQPGTTTPR